MNWSLRLGRVKGIELFIHWTFLIVVGWVAIAAGFAGQSLIAAMTGAGFLLAIFTCVVLHEFGHALMAERYGIPTRDITLLPIGGIARLERLPDDPQEELKIALAGPAVNVAIAALLLVSASLLHAVAPSSGMISVWVGFLTQLAVVNIGLTLFNMLPAFPLDGGRVLRSLLAMRLDHTEATRFAAALGKAFAIVIGLVGLFFNWMLVLVALFVYFGAEHESRLVDARSALKENPTRDAMMTRFHVLSRYDTLQQATNEWVDSMQPDFPVVDHGRLVGVLDCGHLVQALAEAGPEEQVGNVMQRDWPVVQDSDALETAFEKLRADGHDLLPVVHDGRLVGVVTMQSIGKWMKVHAAFEPSESSLRSL